MAELRTALRQMPKGADLIRLRKMPADLQGGPNPFAQLNDVGPCSLNGNLVTTGDDFEAYRYSLNEPSVKSSTKLACLHAQFRRKIQDHHG